LIPVVRVAIAAAMIDPIKYDALKSDVIKGRSFGYASSAIKEEPEMMAKRMPTPSSMRAMMYMATVEG